MPFPSGSESLGDIPIAAQFFDKGGAVYNVMHPDFGAVGDGVNDDGPAINAALEEAETGGIVVIPPGTYKLDTAVVFPGAADQVLLWILPGVTTTGSNPSLPVGSGTNSKLDWSNPGGGSEVFEGYPVTTAQIDTGAVTTVKLGDASVTTEKIGDDQVTTAKIGDSQVTSTKINDGSIVEAKIGDSQVTSTKLGSDSVTTAKIGASQVTATELADGSVVEAKIGSQAVTVTKIGDNEITQIKMSSGLFVPEIVGSLPSLPDASYPQGAVVVLTTDDKLYRSTGSAWTVAVPTSDLTGTIDLGSQVSGTLTSAFVEAGLINSNVTINADGSLSGAGGGQASLTSLPGTIAAGQIASNAVTTVKLNALAVTAAKIAAGAIETDKLDANAVTAAKIATGTITTNEIAANTIVAGNIAVGAIGTDELAAEAVVAGKIAAGTITSNEIASGTITSSEIASGTIVAGNIASGTIVAANIAAGTITADELDITSLDAIAADIGTITAGTIQANVIIGASTFTNTTPVFEGSVSVEGGDGDTRVNLSGVSSGGYAAFYLDPAGAGVNHVEGEISVFENASWDEFTITAQDRLRLISGDGTGDEDITLEPARDIDFQTATDTGRSATSDYMRIRINGTVRYLLLYS